ncbi:MAG: DUF4331 domain-containing protein [Chloroflexota bacterium]|nr:DUF4331 domain-containing protein [Chloroflexota bacterium]
MSSHAEAPEIAKDPVADNTDVYAFVSPDKPDTVTLIANYVPRQGPDGGPNFYVFGDDVLYEIHIDNDGDAKDDIVYQFRFQTQTRNPNTFLYNTGPITSIESPNWNRPQFYTVTKVVKGKSTVLGTGLTCPPCNVGFRSTPHYEDLAKMAVHKLPDGETVFAGQRREGFYVDLGAIFDLGALRPFQNLHLIPSAAALGVDATDELNVHSIAIQIPKTLLTRDGSHPTDPSSATSVIGVYASASRQKMRVLDGGGDSKGVGPWVQVSRQAAPLFNEVIIPLGQKNYWNSQKPRNDKQFLAHVANPELANLLPVLYPGVFPHLAALDASKAPRADLEAILLTGLPPGIIGGFQNYTGPTPADLLRLNMAIPPTASPSLLGLLGGDLAGYPNGRRVIDDVTTIELRAIAGLTYPLVNKSYTPDAAAGAISPFTAEQTNKETLGGPVPGNNRYIADFPYLGVPKSGYDVPKN